jgi:type IV pilus assembly protein PilV
VIRRGRVVLAGDAGLTLAEVLVALAVIGIGLVGLAIVIPVSTDGVAEAGQRSTATFLAEQGLERVRAAAWSAEPAIDCLGRSAGDTAPTLDASCPGPAAAGGIDEASVEGHPGYQRVVRISNCGTARACAGVLDDGLRHVEVTVRYGARRNDGLGSRTVSLEALVARR